MAVADAAWGVGAATVASTLLGATPGLCSAAVSEGASAEPTSMRCAGAGAAPNMLSPDGSVCRGGAGRKKPQPSTIRALQAACGQ